MAWTAKVIIRASIISEGITQFAKDDIDIFRLYCNNMMYWEYLNPENILSIKEEDEFIRIDLDRIKIRHSSNRYILINLATKEIIWHNICPDEKYAKKLNHIETLTSYHMRVIC